MIRKFSVQGQPTSSAYEPAGGAHGAMHAHIMHSARSAGPLCGTQRMQLLRVPGVDQANTLAFRRVPHASAVMCPLTHQQNQPVAERPPGFIGGHAVCCVLRMCRAVHGTWCARRLAGRTSGLRGSAPCTAGRSASRRRLRHAPSPPCPAPQLPSAAPSPPEGSTVTPHASASPATVALHACMCPHAVPTLP